MHLIKTIIFIPFFVTTFKRIRYLKKSSLLLFHLPYPDIAAINGTFSMKIVHFIDSVNHPLAWMLEGFAHFGFKTLSSA